MSRLFFFIVVLFACRILTASAQIDPKIQEALKMSASLGDEYWIAIPPNEINPYPTDDLEIYVTSPFDTEMEVYDASTQRTYKRAIKAYEILTLSDSRGETNWTWEVREAETAVAKGIRIRSKHPLSVYVLNSKTLTADGYTAIPTRAWGTEYIAASYYDFNEVKKWAGGFIVVAREDSTDVTIRLRGTGALDAKTSGGKSIGDSIRVTLNEGDVYMVKGDGQTRGLFDLTGSHIVASKTIGLIGFHERTTMPNLLVNGNGRNHLCEMIPSVSAWSTSYSAVNFSREDKNNMGKGDVFRVIAAEPNTRWTLKYYNMNTKVLLGQGGGLLSNAGEFADLAQVQYPTTLTHGFSVWEADKPIFVMQYSCSHSWDGDPILDPFMINVTPEEQFLTSTLFQTPTAGKFTKHRLNLIVKCDTKDPDYITNLQSLEIDGIPVWRHPQAIVPTLRFNHMGGNLHWTTLDFGTEGRAHRITSNGKVRFSGHVYGYGFVDAYGWPITGDATPTRGADTVPPIISGIQTPKSGTITRTVSEAQANASGLMLIALDSTASTNCSLQRQDVRRPGTTVVTSSTVTISVIDCSRPARATWFALDWSGNIAIDTVVFTAPAAIDRNAPVIRPISETEWLWGRIVIDSARWSARPDSCDQPTIEKNLGIRSINVTQSDLVNMSFGLLTALSTDSITPSLTSRYNVWVIDRAKNGSAIVSATDWAGNTTRDTVTYLAPVSVLDAEEGASPIRVFREGTNTVLQSDGAPMTSVSILDLRGRLVVSAQPGSDTWSGTLPPGVYIALILVDGRTFRLPLAAF